LSDTYTLLLSKINIHTYIHTYTIHHLPTARVRSSVVRRSSRPVALMVPHRGQVERPGRDRGNLVQEEVPHRLVASGIGDVAAMEHSIYFSYRSIHTYIQ